MHTRAKFLTFVGALIGAFIGTLLVAGIGTAVGVITGIAVGWRFSRSKSSRTAPPVSSPPGTVM